MHTFLLLALALLPPSLSARGEPAPIRIGVMGAFTGTSAPIGQSMRNGIRLASEKINAEGGLLGRRIELVERDDGSIPAIGTRIAHELSRLERVDAVLGFTNTPVALPALDALQAARVPAIIAVATASELTRRHAGEQVNYVFRTACADKEQAEQIVQEAIHRDGLRRVAILADTSPYGLNGERELLLALARHGIRPVAVQRFAQHERDLSPAVRAARQAGAETLLTYALGPQLAGIANGMEQLGWRVPILGSWTLSISNFIDHAGPNAEGTRMVQTFIEDSAEPGQHAFTQLYYRRFHTRRMAAPAAAAQGYDAMLLLAQAIREAGSTEAGRIVLALENLSTPVRGVVARYHRPFSRQDHEALDGSVPVIGTVRAGRVTFAHPQDKTRSLPSLRTMPRP